MENRNTILNELKEISAVVAGIGNAVPYSVPEGYFENLPVEIMLRIAIDEKAGIDPVLNINKDNTYEVPQGYFDGLAGNIMNRIKQQEEIENNVEEPSFASPVWQQIGKKNPFTLPEGYFSDFSENVVAGVKAIAFVNEELENLSPVMNSLRDKQVYEVPAGYFSENPAILLKKAKQQPAKVISIGWGKKIMRYASAAAVTGIAVLSVYFYAGKQTANPPSGKPGSGPVAEAKSPALDLSLLAKISDPEIESFLNNNTVALAEVGADTLITVAPEDTSADDTKDLLADISDEELQQYVDQQHPETPITN